MFYWGLIIWINGKIFFELLIFLEWIVIRVIIFWSFVVLLIDRVFYYIEFEEEYKCKGKGCY